MSTAQKAPAEVPLLTWRRGHRPTQTEWPHVRPDLIDVFQAFLPDTILAYLAPTAGNLVILPPDRILLLIIDDDRIDRRIGILLRSHLRNSSTANATPLVQTKQAKPHYITRQQICHGSRAAFLVAEKFKLPPIARPRNLGVSTRQEFEIDHYESQSVVNRTSNHQRSTLSERQHEEE